VTRLKWKLDSVCSEIVLTLCKIGACFAPNVPLAKKCFGCTRCNSLVTWVMRNLVSVHLGTMLVSMQNRSMVCAKRTIGSEIILDAPNDTPW
jgi:hypothetical protein